MQFSIKINNALNKWLKPVINISTLLSTVATEDVQFSYLEIKSHIESVGVMLHAGGGPADSKLPGNYGTAALENWDLTTKHQGY